MTPTEDDDDQNQESNRLQTLTLDLFDLYWFRSLVLLKLPAPSPPLLSPPPPAEAEWSTSSPPPAEAEWSTSSPPPAEAESSTSSPPPPHPPDILLRRRRNHHQRSLSDDFSRSPTLQIHPPKLQTILSGKESSINDEIPKFDPLRIGGESRRRRRQDEIPKFDPLRIGGESRRRRRQRRRCESSSKSLSELEFEELKGFMDLGFTFSDVESDPRLMEIVPGLQRLKAAEEDDVAAEQDDDVAVVRRPYLSEAWEEEEEEENIPVRRFEIPIEGEGVDLKDRLKFWAQAVASTVR